MEDGLFLLAEVEDREVYRAYGCSGIAHYGQFHLRIDGRKARELARLGRVMPGLPQLLEGFVRGEVDYSQLREISRVATPETEAEWLELARHRTANQIQRIVARVRRGHSLQSAAEAGDADAEDEMTFRFTLSKEEGRRLREAVRDWRKVLPGCDDAEIFYALVIKGAMELKDETLLPVDTIVLFHDPATHATFAPSDEGFEEVSSTTFERCLCDCAIVDMRPKVPRELDTAVEDEASARPTGVAAAVHPTRPPEVTRVIPRAVP
ncbi:MAG: hypothetical protein ACYCW6_03735 [Candidatus Xenobia bacterium]